jgi:ribosomal-protein-alanine N-acetyltransferase
MRIQTLRLELIACDRDLLRVLISDKVIFEKLLDIKIPEKFTEYGLSPLRYSMEKLEDLTESDWWTYLPILKDTNMLIGTCGYKGKPDENGMVEIAYEIIEPLRNQGYAREIAKALINRAFQFEQVKIVRAHTFPQENASVKVLKSCNLKFIDTSFDAEDGVVWRWEILK